MVFKSVTMYRGRQNVIMKYKLIGQILVDDINKITI
jgi:hypothetical protein